MLCQLVCVDRRYQRMNCFNIRELQGILKRRFFTDLVNTNDFRTLMDESIIGLRFKTNGEAFNTNSALLVYKYGTTTTNKNVTSSFSNVSTVNSRNFLSQSSLDFELLSSLQSMSFGKLSLANSLSFLNGLVQLLFSSFPSYTALLSFVHIPANLKAVLATQFTTNFSLSQLSISATHQTLNNSGQANEFVSSLTSATNNLTSSDSSYIESSSFRNLRFSNPVISYDYKCGNYIRI